jgi:hypothetical protein
VACVVSKAVGSFIRVDDPGACCALFVVRATVSSSKSCRVDSRSRSSRVARYPTEWATFGKVDVVAAVASAFSDSILDE